MSFSLYGGPAYSATAGGGSIFFKGGSSSQYAQSSAALPLMTQWTVETWHYYSGTEAWSNGYAASAIVADIQTTSMNFLLGNSWASNYGNYHGLGASFVGSASGADWVTASPSQTTEVLTAGNWYHVVGTYDGTSLKLYINGVLSASTPTTKAPATGGTGIVLMRRWDNADWAKGQNWGGRLAIVRIYNVALSSTSVLASYNKDSARFTSTPTSLLSAYSSSAYQIAADNLVATVDLPSQYIISFDAQFSSFSGTWQNILHLTGDGNWGGTEKSRLPTIESCDSGSCCSTCVHIDRQTYTYNDDLMTSALITGTWYTFTIVMDFVSGQMSLSVIPTGGSGEKCATCSAPLRGITQTTFSSVKVWAASPAASGLPAMTSASIRNLAIEAPSSSDDNAVSARVNSGSWPEFGQTGWSADDAGGDYQTNINVCLSATNSASTSIVITRIMYYKTVAGNAAMTTARVGGVYSSDGTLRGSTVTFTGETSSGWQTQALSTPVTIAPGGSFRVVVNMRSYVTSIFPSTTEGIFTNLCSYYDYGATIAYPTTAQCYFNRMIDFVYTTA